MSERADFRMHQALTGHILRHRPTSYIAITAAQTLMLAGLWDALPHNILLTWYLAMQVIAIPHLIICLKYAGKELTPDQVGYIRTVFIVYSLASSTQWGSLTWLLSDTWDIHTFIILLPLMGIFAGAINLAAILPIYFCLVTPILVQSLSVLLFTAAANPLIAGLFGIYYAGMIKFAIELNKMLVRTYSMQFELGTANSELVLQKQAAEKANTDKSRFLAAASHDLRQPLYAMELFLGGLGSDAGEDQEKRTYLLSRLRYAMESMRAMFSSLLDMSRFDAGVITPDKRNISINMLLHTLELKFADEFKRKGLRLIVRPTYLWGYSDPVLVQRVLENYTSNALKYTDSGGVLVACRGRGDNISLEVWDTGRGIKHDEIDTIFDAFHQLDNPERDRKKGVGLGLSIVDQIANLLDTPVSVRSRYGRGSVFSIILPRGDREQLLQHDPDDVIQINSRIFLDLKIWIVDDDADIREGLQLQLETWGCVTRTFENQEQVKAFVDKNSGLPDLLICDLRLRDHQSGIEVIEMVRAQGAGAIPAIIITGDTGPMELQLITRTGMPLLHKPVTAEKLRQTIAQVVKV